MRKLLPLIIIASLLTAESHAVDRNILSGYESNFSLNTVRSESKKALLSVHGLDFKQEIRDFNQIKGISFYNFQTIAQSYNKSKYCEVPSYEVSLFRAPIYYLPALKNKVSNVLGSKGYKYDYYKSTLQGVQLYKNDSNGKEKLSYIHKITATQYILAICTLKGG